MSCEGVARVKYSRGCVAPSRFPRRSLSSGEWRVVSCEWLVASVDSPLATRHSYFTAMPSFPSYRPRRLRRTEPLRRLVRETQLAPAQLVLPLFVRSGRGVRQPVGSMPGVCQTSVDEMIRDAHEAERIGIGGVMLFGIPDKKDAMGSSAWDDRGPVQEAVRALKRECPRLVVVTDVC